MVPHLATALTGPINELEQRMLESMPAIERWFRLEWMEHTPSFYASVAVHNAGFKLTPVDTNLFPSGWNYLAPEMLPLAVQAAMAAIEKICPEAKNLLLVPQNDTQDPAYQDNLARLSKIFNLAGLNVRLGSLRPELNAPISLSLPSGEHLNIDPLSRTPRRLGLKYFDPCTVLLNTDLNTGIPGMLEDLNEQYLLPPLHAAWPTRRQHRHFEIYEELAKRFAKMLGMDVWLIHPASVAWTNIGIKTTAGLESLQTLVDTVLTKTRRKYKEYGINEKPFVLIKSNQGSAELGQIDIRDSKDIPHLLQHPLFATGHDLLVQEGVQTQERIQNAIAEPQVYMMDRYVVGGYYRLQTSQPAPTEQPDRTPQQFVPLAFEQSAQLPQPGMQPGISAPNRFYMYGVIARLALLAASYELEATDPEAEIYD